jgi:hypothetical protein
LVGSAALPLFSKKGRLKTGPQQLKVHEGADVLLGASGGGGGGSGAASSSGGGALPASEPGPAGRRGAPLLLPAALLAGKPRLGARGEVAQLSHLAALYARGDIQRCGWLDALTSQVRREAEATGFQ